MPFYLSANIDEICKRKSMAIIPMESNCAQYYNCSSKKSALGHHAKECTYPDLFSKVSNKCQHFENVSCENRTEPMAPCK